MSKASRTTDSHSKRIVRSNPPCPKLLPDLTVKMSQIEHTFRSSSRLFNNFSRSRRNYGKSQLGINSGKFPAGNPFVTGLVIRRRRFVGVKSGFCRLLWAVYSRHLVSALCLPTVGVVSKPCRTRVLSAYCRLAAAYIRYQNAWEPYMLFSSQ